LAEQNLSSTDLLLKATTVAYSLLVMFRQQLLTFVN